jgi:hypothetical protein
MLYFLLDIFGNAALVKESKLAWAPSLYTRSMKKRCKGGVHRQHEEEVQGRCTQVA